MKDFSSTRNWRVQVLEISERTTRTSEGSAKVVYLLVLNSIICVFLDRRLNEALQFLLMLLYNHMLPDVVDDLTALNW